MATLKGTEIATSYKTLMYRGTYSIPYTEVRMMDLNGWETETGLELGVSDVRIKGNLNEVPVNLNTLVWSWMGDGYISLSIQHQFYITPLFGKDSQYLGTLGGDLSGTATGTPSTSKAITGQAGIHVDSMYYVPYDLELVGGRVFLTGTSAFGGGTPCRCFIMKYDVDTSNSATGGDLSNGVVMATCSIENPTYIQINTAALSLSIGEARKADVGQVLFAVWINDSEGPVNPNISIQLQVKYGSIS